MIRGSQNFKNIFTETEEKQDAKPKKGRNSDLYSKRNECLIDRYFFYGSFTALRYEVIVETLSAEFWLTEGTIPRLVEDHLDRLIEMKKAKPSKQYFQKKWPHLVW